MSPRKLGEMPWGETAVLLGIWLGLAAFIVPRLLIGPTAGAVGAERAFTDIGNSFEKAAAVAEYADLRLVRAAAGNAVPDPPRIHGDVVAARVAWGYAILATLLFGGIALVAGRQGPGRFASLTGLRRFDFDRLWIPGLAVMAVYLASGLYTRAIDAFGIDALQGEPGGLEVTARDSWALALYGVTTLVAAPFGEELFYRGLVFGGLSQWGFLPASAVSSVLFALSHLDAATVIPFACAGLVMCWLYWRSGSLWDAIAFHVLFNLLSFILLLARI
ncbi:MAG: CPBP family intramembrane metalloprotease [Dehalococcoidia bacterium]|nr:CPBP family intramembrane metalloprotease [Dehalococcoidia bacterium]